MRRDILDNEKKGYRWEERFWMKGHTYQQEEKVNDNELLVKEGCYCQE